jgi:hypothetical protein
VSPLRLLALGVMGSFLSLVVCCRFGPSALFNMCILSRRGPHGVPPVTHVTAGTCTGSRSIYGQPARARLRETEERVGREKLLRRASWFIDDHLVPEREDLFAYHAGQDERQRLSGFATTA